MTLTIPSKSEKEVSQLRDGLRVLAWQHFKSTNSVSGLEGYELFAEEWSKHACQEMDMNRISQFIKTLGYTEAEILQIRSEYYRSRNQAKGSASVSADADEMPY